MQHCSTKGWKTERVARHYLEAATSASFKTPKRKRDGGSERERDGSYAMWRLDHTGVFYEAGFLLASTCHCPRPLRKNLLRANRGRFEVQ